MLLTAIGVWFREGDLMAKAREDTYNIHDSRSQLHSNRMKRYLSRRQRSSSKHLVADIDEFLSSMRTGMASQDSLKASLCLVLGCIRIL